MFVSLPGGDSRDSTPLQDAAQALFTQLHDLGGANHRTGLLSLPLSLFCKTQLQSRVACTLCSRDINSNWWKQGELAFAFGLRLFFGYIGWASFKLQPQPRERKGNRMPLSRKERKKLSEAACKTLFQGSFSKFLLYFSLSANPWR